MRIDAHCDTALYLLEEASLRSLPQKHLDFCRLRSNIDLQFFAVFIDSAKTDGSVAPKVLTVLERLREDIVANSDLTEQLLWREQLQKDVDKTKILFAVEGGEVLDGQLPMLKKLFMLGVRSLGLTWNHENALGGGADSQKGLTEFGFLVIEEMNRLGMVVDGAHLSQGSFWNMLAVAKKPPIVSHACCSGLWQHCRNLDDRQLRALGECGGVVGITFAESFLGASPCVEDIVRHIDYAVNKAGLEHVGIGSDFDGTDLPQGMNGVCDWHLLTDGLEKLGYCSFETDKIMGGNFLRVLSENLPNC